MADEHDSSHRPTFYEASGLPQLFGVLRLTLAPSKLLLVLAGIFATFVLGGLLDYAWVATGHGVSDTAIGSSFTLIQPGALSDAENAAQSHGVFEVWRVHECDAIAGVLGSVWQLSPTALVVETARVVHGVTWMVRSHPFFALPFGIGTLLIWSFFGGAVCRMTAVKFARGDDIGWREACGYVRKRLLGGFFLAPIVPIIAIVLCFVILIVGGAALRIPGIDSFASLLTLPAILVGFGITFLAFGLALCGHLYWPAIAVESCDALDAAFSRSVNYVLSKSIRAVLYALVGVAFAGVCWSIVSAVTSVSLMTTRAAVDFGTSYWQYGGEGAAGTKLAALWSTSGAGGLHSWPQWDALDWWEYPPALFTGVFVLFVIGLTWSFLGVFYFNTCTTIYFLLRRDVDGIDLEDVYCDDDDESSPPSDTAGFGADSAPVQTDDRHADASEPVVTAPVGSEPGSPEPVSSKPGTSLPILSEALPPAEATGVDEADDSDKSTDNDERDESDRSADESRPSDTDESPDTGDDHPKTERHEPSQASPPADDEDDSAVRGDDGDEGAPQAGKDDDGSRSASEEGRDGQ